MARVAALTGATGFIGRELLRQLLLAGWTVRALTRRPVAQSDIVKGVTWIKGDLRSPKALTELVEGSDAIIHLAGAVKARGRPQFFEANAAGVEAMMEAASRKADAAHFMLISSLAAREPHLSDYAGSKAAGEENLRQSGALNWTIIRPPAVYGPGDLEILKIFKSLKYGIGFLAGRPENRLSIIHVRDLCAGIIATLGQEAAFGRLLHIDDGREGGYTLAEIMMTGARILDKKPSLIRFPRLAFALAAGVNQGYARLTGRTPMLTLGKVRELHHTDWVCGGEKISDFCSWRAHIDVETGLKETIDWYRKKGLI
jgi:nucleoside-diphosphate-sugar epimerase